MSKNIFICCIVTFQKKKKKIKLAENRNRKLTLLDVKFQVKNLAGQNFRTKIIQNVGDMRFRYKILPVAIL